jgi:molybdate transport system substrate-binding protein
MLKKSGYWLLLTLLCLAACTSPPTSRTLTVFAAASLQSAFTEIGQAFEAQNPGVSVVFNFAGSQQLARQLAEGAPADVFANADWRQMEAVVEAGRIRGGEARAFAGNRLVVVIAQANPGQIRQLPDLGRPGLKLVLAAPAVPVGAYTLEYLEKAAAAPGFPADFKQAVLRNVVSYEENVRAVLGKVALGEADAGIVYVSDVTGAAAERVGRLDIPDPLNVSVQYPIAIVADSAASELAGAFVAWVRAPEGQAVLARHGFLASTP